MFSKLKFKRVNLINTSLQNKLCGKVVFIGLNDNDWFQLLKYITRKSLKMQPSNNKQNPLIKRLNIFCTKSFSRKKSDCKNAPTAVISLTLSAFNTEKTRNLQFQASILSVNYHQNRLLGFCAHSGLTLQLGFSFSPKSSTTRLTCDKTKLVSSL